MTPVYVPFSNVQRILQSVSTKHEFIVKILKSIHFEGGHFSYKA